MDKKNEKFDIADTLHFVKDCYFHFKKSSVNR